MKKICCIMILILFSSCSDNSNFTDSSEFVVTIDVNEVELTDDVDNFQGNIDDIVVDKNSLSYKLADILYNEKTPCEHDLDETAFIYLLDMNNDGNYQVLFRGFFYF